MVDTSDIDDLDPFDLLDTESERVDAFLSSLDEEGWNKQTRAELWRVREMLSHLDGVEVYHTACLDDRVKELWEEAQKHGAKDGDSFNAWFVEERAGKPVQEVLESWRAANAEVRRRMRERGREGTMSSSVGKYPVGLMAFHIASEYATHADDMAVPMDDSERAAQLAWRAKVSLFAIKEADKPVRVEPRGEEFVVRLDGKEATISRHDFVEAVTARLPEDHPLDPEVRDALRALA